jgi:hypothetical protein
LRSSRQRRPKSSVPRSTVWPRSAPTHAPNHGLLAVWLKSHADGSPHSIRVYKRVGDRLLSALAASGSNLRQATVEDVQAALEALRTKEDAASVRPATVNTYVAAVMSFLGFAHRVGFTRFNAGPLIGRGPRSADV